MALFMAGSLIGFFIQGNDAVVPAHYHGMMGAVTLACMGLAYRVCPRLGLMAPSASTIRLQARLYAAGIGLVMLGLILSDLPRKALASAASVDLSLLAGRISMAIGGSAALLASLLFIVLMLRAFLHAPGKGAWLRRPLELSD